MKKSMFANTLLVFISVLATLAVLEVCIEKTMLDKIPLKFHFALPTGLEVLAQSSKTHRLPQQYVALAGDSYAQGKGDWLLQTNPDTNGAFNAAHVLQQLTGRDVITFGKSDSSSTKGWVREAIAKYQYLHAAVDSNIQPPDVIFAFFYAGNDLSDNVLEMRNDFISQYGEAALHDDAVWNAYFDKMLRKSKVGPFGTTSINRGWLARALCMIIKGEIKHKGKTDQDNENKANNVANKPGNNTVLINGQPTVIPGGLQSPGLELDTQQTDVALLVVSKSLARLKQAFPTSQLVVVYVPSVIESYTLAAPANINNAVVLTGAEQHTAVELAARSDEIAQRVAQIAHTQGLLFLDTRRDIQAAGALHIIHGPQDWLHFNRLGYEALAHSIACGMATQHQWPASACTAVAQP